MFAHLPFVMAPAAKFSGLGTSRFWIQLLLIVTVAVVAIALTRSRSDARHLAIRRILMTLFAAVAIYFIIFPSAATKVARLFGVGRGADLLTYGLVIAFLVFVATSFKRTAALEERITTLARAVAIAQAPSPAEVYGERYPAPTPPTGIALRGERIAGPPPALGEADTPGAS